MKIHDISLPISSHLTKWPGHPPIIVNRYRSLEKGDSSNSSLFSCSVHTGTHVDAPSHFLKEKPSVEELPLNKLIGPAFVLEILGAKEITRQDLEKAKLPENTKRLLIKTTNSLLWTNLEHEFRSDYVAVSSDAAEWLVEKKMVLVGVDYLSIQKFKDAQSTTHSTLLTNNIIILEGVNLQEIKPGPYLLVCLPLKIVGSDGAPARVVLIEESATNEKGFMVHS